MSIWWSLIDLNRPTKTRRCASYTHVDVPRLTLDFLFSRFSHGRLGVRLDDGLFQRLVGSRWDSEKSRSDSRGVDCEEFVRLYQGVFTPAITFGRHLRKAAGRGDDELGENQRSTIMLRRRAGNCLRRMRRIDVCISSPSSHVCRVLLVDCIVRSGLAPCAVRLKDTRSNECRRYIEYHPLVESFGMFGALVLLSSLLSYSRSSEDI